jgi:hypothetical protein
MAGDLCGRMLAGLGIDEVGVVDRNLVANFRGITFYDTLADMTFDQVVELFWEAKRRRAERDEWNASRVADPNSMVGKSPQYVADYYAKQREAVHEIDNTPP